MKKLALCILALSLVGCSKKEVPHTNSLLCMVGDMTYTISSDEDIRDTEVVCQALQANYERGRADMALQLKDSDGDIEIDPVIYGIYFESTLGVSK